MKANKEHSQICYIFGEYWETQYLSRYGSLNSVILEEGIRNLRWNYYPFGEIKHCFMEKMNISLYLQEEVSFCEDLLLRGKWDHRLFIETQKFKYEGQVGVVEICSRLFSVTIAKYLKLGSVERKGVYLIHRFAQCLSRDPLAFFIMAYWPQHGNAILVGGNMSHDMVNQDVRNSGAGPALFTIPCSRRN